MSPTQWIRAKTPSCSTQRLNMSPIRLLDWLPDTSRTTPTATSNNPEPSLDESSATPWGSTPLATSWDPWTESQETSAREQSKTSTNPTPSSETESPRVSVSPQSRADFDPSSSIHPSHIQLLLLKKGIHYKKTQKIHLSKLLIILTYVPIPKSFCWLDAKICSLIHRKGKVDCSPGKPRT